MYRILLKQPCTGQKQPREDSKATANVIMYAFNLWRTGLLLYILFSEGGWWLEKISKILGDRKKKPRHEIVYSKTEKHYISSYGCIQFLNLSYWLIKHIS